MKRQQGCTCEPDDWYRKTLAHDGELLHVAWLRLIVAAGYPRLRRIVLAQMRRVSA